MFDLTNVTQALLISYVVWLVVPSPFSTLQNHSVPSWLRDRRSSVGPSQIGSSRNTEISMSTISIASSNSNLQQKQQPEQQDKRQQSRHRNVRFLNSVEVKEIPSFTTYSTNEINRCWYSSEERVAMAWPKLSLEARKRIPKSCDAHSKDRGDCFRGLECQTIKGSFRMKTRCQAAHSAVMDVQQLRQRSSIDSSHDAQVLAEICEARTKQCQVEARDLALADEAYVKTHVYGLPCSPKLVAAQATILRSDILKLCTCYYDASNKKRKQSIKSKQSLSPIRMFQRFCKTSRQVRTRIDPSDFDVPPL